MLTYCRLSLRLVNKSPEDIIFTTFFQESFPAVYNFDANKPRVELIKAVHPRQVTRTTTYLRDVIRVITEGSAGHQRHDPDPRWPSRVLLRAPGSPGQGHGQRHAPAQQHLGHSGGPEETEACLIPLSGVGHNRWPGVGDIKVGPCLCYKLATKISVWPGSVRVSQLG